jgi:hypothetical protein
MFNFTFWRIRKDTASARVCYAGNGISICLTAIAAASVCFITCARATAEDAVPRLTRAVAELPADASVFELPQGTYTIGSTWTIPRAGITIRGAGVGKTVLVRDADFKGPLVNMNGEASTITALTIDGNCQRQEKIAPELALHGAKEIAEKVEVKNFCHIGIAVFASECRISRCIITGVGGPAIQNIGIWRDAGRLPTSAVITLDHNVVKDIGLNGIYCTGGKITIADNQLSGNHSYTTVGGGQIDIGNAFTTNTDALITGNTILNGGGIKTGGMELGGGTFTVRNNTIRGHGSGGIGIGHNVIKATISGNIISNSGHNIAEKNSPQDRSGIYVGYGAANVEISDNRCFDDQPGKTQTWGIILVGPPARPDSRFSPKAIEHLVIKGNDLRGNAHSNGVLDQSHARDRSISGNLPAEANR